MASAILQEISRDENERALFRSRKKYEMDMFTNMNTADRKGEMRSDEKWKAVVADKDAKLADKDAKLADKDAKLADKDAEIARLRAELEKR